MPDLITHCAISKARTGNDYAELHKWIDESKIGCNHRIERHTYLTDYEKYIEEKFGKYAVVEWLFHIGLDNLETAHKLALKEYKDSNAHNKSFSDVLVQFKDKNMVYCGCLKYYLKSAKWFEWGERLKFGIPEKEWKEKLENEHN